MNDPPLPTDVTIIYEAGGVGTVTVGQVSSDDRRRLGTRDETREIVRDGLTLTIREKPKHAAMVGLTLDGTWIEIASYELEVEPLIELVTHLRPAPTISPSI